MTRLRRAKARFSVKLWVWGYRLHRRRQRGVAMLAANLSAALAGELEMSDDEWRSAIESGGVPAREARIILAIVKEEYAAKKVRPT